MSGDPKEPTPFEPTEGDAPTDPETGAPEIDEPDPAPAGAIGQDATSSWARDALGSGSHTGSGGSSTGLDAAGSITGGSGSFTFTAGRVRSPRA